MKLLVVADIHGDIEKLGKLMDSIKPSGYDAIICPGDFTDMFSSPKEFSQMDMANLMVQKLAAPGLPLLCVPGNHDPYEILEVFRDHDADLHGKCRDVAGMRFAGWGGAPTPFNTIFEPEEEETKETLGSMARDITPGNFVLVTHDPPRDTEVDKTSSGDHVGSRAIREFIERKSPILCVSAHIHESPGQGKIGGTTLFYPGPIFGGSYGVVDISSSGVTCQQKKLELTPFP